MRIFKKDPDFKFMNKKYIAFIFSGIIIAAGIITFYTKGFNLGIDFTGGTMVEVSFKNNLSVGDLRSSLGKVGLGKSEITRVGKNENKFFIKTIQSLDEKGGELKSSEEGEDLSTHEKITNLIKETFRADTDKEMLSQGKIDINNSSVKKITDFISSQGISHDIALEGAEQIDNLKKQKSGGLILSLDEIRNLDLKKRVLTVFEEKSFLGNFTFLSSDFVGSQVGYKLRQQTTLATIWALMGMLIYIGFRFRFIFGIAAVITLFHDILIALSFILFFNIEFSLQVVAAILTIVGYSLNDTIVIFDRVRDNLKLMRKDNAEKILDRSINQTLSRTIVTSGTTLATVLSLFFLGGEVIHAFSFTLIVGVITGTYSSIFQSCAWLKIWESRFIGKKSK
ncbi:MAG: protein translocase subunit SecF [Acidobacteriota bacterium]